MLIRAGAGGLGNGPLWRQGGLRAICRGEVEGWVREGDSRGVLGGSGEPENRGLNLRFVEG